MNYSNEVNLSGKKILRIFKQAVLLGTNTEEEKFYSEVKLLNLGVGCILVEPAYVNNDVLIPLSELSLLKQGESL